MAVPEETRRRGVLLRRVIVAGAAVLVGGSAAWLTVRNATGLRVEYAAIDAQRGGEYVTARERNAQTEQRLLDPVRILMARARHLRCGLELAREAFERWQQAVAEGAPGAAEASALAQRAAVLCKSALREAQEFAIRVPNFDRAWAYAARCCEMLSVLSGRRNPLAARRWGVAAWSAWDAQRRARPYDRETLLAMAAVGSDGRFRYTMALGDRLGLLRDALRAGFADATWLQALRLAARDPAFPVVLDGLVRTARPYTPQTDIDALVISGAPETYRLRAYWHDANGRCAEAAADAERAARLLEPLRPRFPKLLSVALAEQAEFTFRATPDDPQEAIRLAREAITRYPRIQPQQYREQIMPFRWNLLRYLLAAGQDEETQAVLRELAGDNAAAQHQMLAQVWVDMVRTLRRFKYVDRGLLADWCERALQLEPQNPDVWLQAAYLAADKSPQAFQAVLERAARAGLNERVVAQIRAQVCRDQPALCTQPATQP